MNDDQLGYLRYYIAHLVRIWTVLCLFKGQRNGEPSRTIADVCSDKLRIMLYELANKQDWTLGFRPDVKPRYDKLFRRLDSANAWFRGKNGLHARNCSGAHLQPLDRATHMTQMFGYTGAREWKHLTRGVAACLAMMKLVDTKSNAKFWKKIRLQVSRKTSEDAVPGSGSIPIAIQALFQ